MSDDERLAQLFLARGSVWLQGSNAVLRVRIADVGQDEAELLKTRFRGYVSQPTTEGRRFWRTGTRQARLFLLAVAPWVQLKPTRRERRRTGDDRNKQSA